MIDQFKLGVSVLHNNQIFGEIEMMTNDIKNDIFNSCFVYSTLLIVKQEMKTVQLEVTMHHNNNLHI